MKILKRIIIFCIIYLLLVFGIGDLLKEINLQFRPWVETSAIPVIGVLIITVLILIIRVLSNLSKKVSIVSSIVGIILSGIILLYTIFFTVFSHSPEHVVERDGKKMLAVVTSWTDTDVNYHLYKNWFVMSREWLISEYYGSGSFDPLEKNSQLGSSMLTPKRTTYNKTYYNNAVVD